MVPCSVDIHGDMLPGAKLRTSCKILPGVHCPPSRTAMYSTARYQRASARAATPQLPAYRCTSPIRYPSSPQSMFQFYNGMIPSVLPPNSAAPTPAAVLAALPYGVELGILLSYGIQSGDARRFAVSYLRSVLHDNMALEPAVQVGGDIMHLHENSGCCGGRQGRKRAAHSVHTARWLA